MKSKIGMILFVLFIKVYCLLLIIITVRCLVVESPNSPCVAAYETNFKVKILSLKVTAYLQPTVSSIGFETEP